MGKGSTLLRRRRGSTGPRWVLLAAAQAEFMAHRALKVNRNGRPASMALHRRTHAVLTRLTRPAHPAARTAPKDQLSAGGLCLAPVQRCQRC